MTDTPSALLHNWLSRQATGDTMAWFDQQMEKLAGDATKKSFDISFGMVPRKLGKDDLALTKEDLGAADAVRPGWNPSLWSLDVAARVYLLIELSRDETVSFAGRFKELHRTADVGELMALYSGLPLYSAPETLINITADGLRTNIKAEFEAIAHRNPFPAEQFEQNPWNNMVLKSLFIGVMLNPIQGLESRANPELARILRDYAHERWAADRFVSPELWRCIGPFAEGEYLDDFKRVVDSGNPTEMKAVALALSVAPASDGKNDLRAKLSAFEEGIRSGEITWTAIANEMLDNSLAVTRKLNFEVELKK